MSWCIYRTPVQTGESGPMGAIPGFRSVKAHVSLLTILSRPLELSYTELRKGHPVHGPNDRHLFGFGNIAHGSHHRTLGFAERYVRSLLCLSQSNLIRPPCSSDPFHLLPLFPIPYPTRHDQHLNQLSLCPLFSHLSSRRPPYILPAPLFSRTRRPSQDLGHPFAAPSLVRAYSSCQCRCNRGRRSGLGAGGQEIVGARLGCPG